METLEKTLIVASGGCMVQIEAALGYLMAMKDAGLIGGSVPDSQLVARGTSAGAAVLAATACDGWDPFKVYRRLFDLEKSGKRLVEKKWFWPLRMFWGDQAIYDRTGFELLLSEIMLDKKLGNVHVVACSYPEMIPYEFLASVQSVLASTSIPRVFKKVDMGGKLYVDGGYADNVPLAPWAPSEYGRVFILLPPRDVGETDYPSTFLGKAYQSLDVKVSQEVNEVERIYADEKRFQNVTVFRMPPVRVNLFHISKNFETLFAAYEYAREVLKNRGLE